ncbi:MAG: signal peptidase II [Tenericutes bacterium]|jgi:signal peptidase II|nr:signal peptidase II [Mycoplasmatota bacterium]
MKKWIALMVGLLAFDQLTKFLVATYEINYGLIEGFLHITYVRNLGLVFGMFQGATTTYTLVLTIFALIALSIFGVMFYKNDFKDKRTHWYALALTLLIAGTLGNAIDRLFQPDHGVIDFIDFRGLGDLWTYVFNFADVYLNVGLVILFIDVFFLENKRRKEHE